MSHPNNHPDTPSLPQPKVIADQFAVYAEKALSHPSWIRGVSPSSNLRRYARELGGGHAQRAELSHPAVYDRATARQASSDPDRPILKLEGGGTEYTYSVNIRTLTSGMRVYARDPRTNRSTNSCCAGGAPVTVARHMGFALHAISLEEPFSPQWSGTDSTDTPIVLSARFPEYPPFEL